MVKSLIIGIGLSLVAVQSFGQLLATPERAAAVSITKKHWQKAESKLHKLLQKDSTNVTARYLLADYFFHADNLDFQVDSAYSNILLALKHYNLLSAKEREKMRRFPLDSTKIIALRDRVDSASFNEAKQINTEAGYIKFINTHTTASQRDEASALRDEVAYLDAVNKNTHEAFQEFLNKYPMASNAPNAKRKYERLLYEFTTSDGRLQSFEKFLHDYPETTFRPEIEKNIFELFTLSGDVERFLSFLQLYPSSLFAKKARDIIFHVLLEQDNPQSVSLFITDSLSHVLQLQNSYLVPVLKNNRFGFIDRYGKEVISPVLEHLTDEYKCGNITEDVIVLPDRILARNGAVIYSGNVEEIDDLGAGFLKLKKNECRLVVHKSGFVAAACVDEAKIMGNRFLAVKADGHWIIHSLAGKKLLPEQWDETAMHGSVVALRKNDTWFLFTLNQFIAAAENASMPLPAGYDDIKFLPDNLVWVKQKSDQGVVDQNLKEVIAMNNHKISPAFFGFTSSSENGYSIYDSEGNQSSGFDKILMHQPWVAVHKNGEWFLLDVQSREVKSSGYDSLKFEGPFMLGITPDTLSVHFSENGIEQFVRPITPVFIPGKDSTSFLSLEAEGKKTVYSGKGKKLFTLSYDQIQYAGQDLFIVSKKEKKGLINAEGKMILPVEYDAIGSVSNNVISLLRSMKFGLYNLQLRKLIKPQYEKNLMPYNSHLIAAYQNGLYGFIDWNNKPDSEFEFEEIQYWNDTTALIKKDQLSMFYTMSTRAASIPKIKKVNIIHDSPDEKIAIIQQENAYGVVSNKRGIVIPLAFSDLVNVGSGEEPLYFTEKHVEEASIFVVIYYDSHGKFLRREVYEEPDDYEKIYCSDN